MAADGQMQSIGAGTVVGVSVVVYVCACFGINAIVPCKGFACILIV